ncbi:XdhC family protein [Anaerotignum lactatifermentans]|uniref:XdhC family protein n=1 Tax=Anaerotignum lactatifermentans TaxID=160404 RepID=UPI0025874B2B|nr:XdhC family protein [Anaerotignum lactatifermentans]
MREAYKQLRHYLQELDWVGSGLVYEGPLQGFQFLWQEEGVLWAPEGELETAKKMLLTIGEMKSCTTCEIGENHVFVEHFGMSPRLVILGGGHISLSLVKLGKLLGFHVTVVDDRGEFANLQRFPEADCVLCGDFAQVFEEIPDLPANYYVVVTRGHQADEQCVRQILRRKYAYVGMIGSKNKVAKTKEALYKSGFRPAEVEAIHAPIGLKIGAVTPEEIAVCIAAEIIQEKNKVPVETIEDAVLDALCEDTGSTMALIVAKSGSAPREAGARMVVKDNEILAGTIGGGAVEHAAMIYGSQMPKHHIQKDVQEFVLRKEEGAKLGMVCGGSNLVYFESD